MSLKILLVDDHKIVREGLRTLLDTQSDFSVAAEAADGMSAVKLAQQLKPDVIIMDITLPDLNGIEATRKILNKNPRIKVIALSMHADRRFVLEILKSGARGYLLKDSAFDELVLAIRTVVKNRTYLSPQIADLVVREYIRRTDRADQSAFTLLSAREREVLQMMAEGKATKQIAAKMDISVKTVETFRQQIMNKTGIDNVAGLTKYAIKEGLTNL
ncbi:response regulator transcription factor [candidate division TA06 bacterium]|uniref:Response regulator transcription factor n=1 Tax=candidate division TA06 bacterium TaxID=2250710 RepID=A0A933MJT0_UNCT6|nr:response regulator transcription factor [candidate division TA06 bacterium]